MVSGFFTSPCDQARMSSAVARPMRSSSKTLTSSKMSYFLKFSKILGVQDCAWCPGPAPGAPGAGPVSDLVDAGGGVRPPREVDAELLSGAVHLVVRLLHLDGDTVAREHLDVQAQRLHLLEEDLEGLRDARVGDVLALDDRLVDLHAARDVVGLDGEQLLERVGGAVRLERPHLHLTEALTTELRLTTQRLLRDHRVRAGRARVDLVVDQVVQLQDVHVAGRDGL